MRFSSGMRSCTDAIHHIRTAVKSKREYMWALEYHAGL